MFHAIRMWWMDGRGKLTARLFVFEFIVVVVGVLAAQGLANWVQQRAALAAMEEARARAMLEIAGAMSAASVMKTASPCFEQRMRQVMREAGTGPVSSALAVRPSLKAFNLSPIPDESALLMRKRYGDRWTGPFNNVFSNTANIDRRGSQIATAWGRIAVATPDYGVVSPGDRLAARAAAAEVLAELRGLRIHADNILKWGSRLGIRPKSNAEPLYGPAKTCDAIWKSNRSDPPLTMR